MAEAELSVSTRPAFLTAVTRVDSTGLAEAAVATGAVAMPVKLPAPVLGTAEQAGPKSMAADGEDGEDEDAGELHAAAARARQAARTATARRRWFTVSPSRVVGSLDCFAGRGAAPGRDAGGAWPRMRCRHVTVTTTESLPVAPAGKTPARREVWVVPWLSVARTWSWCNPGAASQVHSHCRQVSMPSAAASRAACQGPLSTLTSTAAMPVAGAQATPAT